MAEFRVTSTRLRESAETISTSSASFKHVIEDLKSTMETVRNAWASEAAEQFFAEFNKLNANFEAYERVINQYSAYLTKTADEYASVDSKLLNDTQVLDGAALYS